MTEVIRYPYYKTGKEGYAKSQVTFVREVAKGHIDSAGNNVVGFNGRLNLRIASQCNEVIRTVQKNFLGRMVNQSKEIVQDNPMEQRRQR